MTLFYLSCGYANTNLQSDILLPNSCCVVVSRHEFDFFHIHNAAQQLLSIIDYAFFSIAGLVLFRI